MTSVTLPYAHIDAFADRPFTGNQAAVMPLETWLPDAVLQAIGEENNFAETAFIVPDKTGEADYELRWFTPTSEVDLCGHATLASGHYVLSQDSKRDSVSFRTRKAGILKVSRGTKGYDMALPATFVQAYDHPELSAALGTGGAPLFKAVRGVEKTTIILLDDADAVRKVSVDMAALTDIPVMAIITAPGDAQSGTDVISRVFVPAWGVPEDSVTGSAHCALATFWSERLGRNSFSAYQASQRGGVVQCRHDGDEAVLSGECFTVVEGRFALPGLG
ncbi:PhzF family phenazine biosynthesis protein [Alterisphingorhabdus coralli]|uniref:PhzF family phenazine biosynthesis protein n=1 Tax=Alterisphingorhabdus coralli TaxID=3071408 RepID=A0AA97F8K0_9SPHN|nr:PhzF family phenazine biosynthesis protein [Parasphingorhabdus sp. SCSIO 66989]WOE75027.1 PhzF family phenazine biosynthesis protein [Parasphingorhabdus sp. SCSIO 66989]